MTFWPWRQRLAGAFREPRSNVAVGAAERGSGGRSQSLPLRQRGEALGSVLPPLLVSAERVATTVAQGVHGRRRTGQGETFWQFRRYAPGDDTSKIDWRQTGKTQHVFIRENEWEAAQSLWLWSDRSASMAYRSSPELPTKEDRAALLVLALATLLTRAGEHVALLGGGMQPATGKSALNRIAESICLPRAKRKPPTDLPPISALPRHSETLWVSDFLVPIERVENHMRLFAALGVRGHMIMTLDPAEEALPFEGRVRFDGLESETPVTVNNVASLRAAYRARMEARRKSLADEAKRLGWTFAAHRTDRSPQGALLAVYSALAGATGVAPVGMTARVRQQREWSEIGVEEV